MSVPRTTGTERAGSPAAGSARRGGVGVIACWYRLAALQGRTEAIGRLASLLGRMALAAD